MVSGNFKQLGKALWLCQDEIFTLDLILSKFFLIDQKYPSNVQVLNLAHNSSLHETKYVSLYKCTQKSQNSWLIYIQKTISSIEFSLCKMLCSLVLYIFSRHPLILWGKGNGQFCQNSVLSLMKLEWPFQGADLGNGIWRLCTAQTTWPPSWLYRQNPKEYRILHLGMTWLHELPESCLCWQSVSKQNFLFDGYEFSA